VRSASRRHREHCKLLQLLLLLCIPVHIPLRRAADVRRCAHSIWWLRIPVHIPLRRVADVCATLQHDNGGCAYQASWLRQATWVRTPLCARSYATAERQTPRGCRAAPPSRHCTHPCISAAAHTHVAAPRRSRARAAVHDRARRLLHPATPPQHNRVRLLLIAQCNIPLRSHHHWPGGARQSTLRAARCSAYTPAASVRGVQR
jgi:hypothetical protein